MKAFVCSAFGPLEDIALREVPDPTPKPNQVRVQIRTASIGFMDTLMIKGLYQLKPPLPYIPGAVGAGDVVEVGSDVTSLRIGDRVSFLNYYGAFAEQIATDEHTAVKIPDSMDYEQAATYRLSYSPAYLALVRRAGLRAGETFLMTGAAGGVGLAAVRLAKVLGARVIAVVSDDRKKEAVLACGADEVINYTTEDLRERVLALTDGRGADVILDVVGGDVFDQCMRCVAFLGRVIVMGFTSGRIPEVKMNRVLLKNCSIIGVWLGDWMTRNVEGFRQMNDELLALAAEGKIPATIAMRFPLADAVTAMQTLLSRQAVGKIVLTND